jgi:hypothetical protein
VLVENLRRLARHEHSDHSIAAEAAARIEKLEAALRHAMEMVMPDANCEECKEIEKLLDSRDD